MDRDAVIHILRAAEGNLRARGVAHAALFGSVARGDVTPESDIDIMIEIAPEARLDVFAYVGIVNAIKDLFSTPVDVSNRGQIREHVRPSAERDAIFAF